MARLLTLPAAIAVAATGAGPSPAAAAPPDPAVFAWSRALEPSPGEPADAPVAAFTLDEAAFLHADDRFADLRIFDSEDREVPRLVRRQRTFESVAEEVPVGLETESLVPNDDGSIEVIVQRARPVGDAPLLPIAAFDLSTGLRDFEKTVHVEGLVGEGAPVPLTPPDGVLVFDYSRFLALRSTRVEVTPGDFDRFRIRIEDATAVETSPIVKILEERRGGEVVGEREHRTLTTRAFRVDRLAAVARRESTRREKDLVEPFTVRDLEVREDPESGDSILEFSADRVPVHRLELTTSSRNFARRIEVEASTAEDPDQWTPIAGGTLVSVETGSTRRSDLELPVRRPGRFARYRARIVNDDNPPLVDLGITLTGESWEAVFFPERDRRYRVLYGTPGLDPPRHDVASVLREDPGAVTARLTLGPEVANPQFRPDAAPKAVPSKTILIVVILGVCALLGVLIARFSRNIEASS